MTCRQRFAMWLYTQAIKDPMVLHGINQMVVNARAEGFAEGAAQGQQALLSHQQLVGELAARN